MDLCAEEIDAAKKSGGNYPVGVQQFEYCRDGWGNPLNYGRFDNGESYVLASGGRDGILDVSTLEAYRARSRRIVTFDFDADLVIVDGKTIQWAGK